MKSYIVHYKNKYPKGEVRHSESGLSVYDSQKKLRVQLAKSGSGDLVDVSEEYGAIDRHDLAPIPKESRIHKLYSREGQQPAIGLSEEHEERSKAIEAILADSDGERIPSMAEVDPSLRGQRMDRSDWKKRDDSWKWADRPQAKKA